MARVEKGGMTLNVMHGTPSSSAMTEIQKKWISVTTASGDRSLMSAS